MSFVQVRQSTQTGERQTFVSASAIAYLQEMNPDQDRGWQIDVKPSRALFYLHHNVQPIISFDHSDDFVRQVKVYMQSIPGLESKTAPKKSINFSSP